MATRLSQYRTVGPALVEQRRALRHRVRFGHAGLDIHVERSQAATLADLSVYGCRLDCASGPDAGERLSLEFRNGDPVAATVVWNDGASLGCRFDVPIARSLVRELTLVIC